MGPLEGEAAVASASGSVADNRRLPRGSARAAPTSSREPRTAIRAARQAARTVRKASGRFGKLAGRFGRRAESLGRKAEWLGQPSESSEPLGRARTAAGRMPRSRASTRMRRSMEETSSKAGLRTAPLLPEPASIREGCLRNLHPRPGETDSRLPAGLGASPKPLRASPQPSEAG
jgi:hypothetical protein